MRDIREIREIAKIREIRKIIFEVCAESVQACLAARDGGADRIEICTALSEGGLTPSHALIREAISRSGLPVHVLLRPRSGDFLYSDDEFAVMREDLLHARGLGASGFVLGILQADDAVDQQRTRVLVELAAPLEVTFNRAFDATASLEQALEDVIATGCRRILTSGGERDVTAGASPLAQLVKLAGGRIDIAVGGGLRVQNAGEIALATGASHFHGSLQSRRSPSSSRSQRGAVEAEDVRAMMSCLLNGFEA